MDAEGVNQVQSRNVSWMWLAAAMPFLLIFASEWVLFRFRYNVFPDEAVYTTVSYGSFWTLGGASRLMHLPSWLYHEIAALIILVFGLPELDFSPYNQAGVVLHLILLACAAWISGRLALLCSLRWIDLFLISAVVALMPTLIRYSTLFAVYYGAGLLLMPSALAFVATLHGHARSPAVSAGYVVFGLSLALIFVNVIPALAFGAALLAVVVASGGRDFVREISGEWPPLLKMLGIFSLVIFLAPAVSDKRPWLQAAIVACGVGTASIIWWKFRWALYGPMGWALIGWLVGANVMARNWATSAFLSMSSKAGAAVPRSPVEMIARYFDAIEWGSFLSVRTWHWTLPLCAIIGIAAAIKYTLHRDRVSLGVGIFLIVLIVLGAAATANLPSYGDMKGWGGFGNESRYFTYLIAGIVVAMAWALARAETRPAGMIAMCVLVFGAGSDYLQSQLPLAPPRAELDMRARENAIVRDFQAQHVDGLIVCVDAVRPDVCTAASMYEHWLNVKDIYPDTPAVVMGAADKMRPSSIYKAVSAPGCSGSVTCAGSLLQDLSGEEVVVLLISKGNLDVGALAGWHARDISVHPDTQFWIYDGKKGRK